MYIRRLRRIYYGWWITIVGALIVGWIGGVGLLGYGVFIVPLGDDFKWNYKQLALVMTISTILSGIVSPVIGWAIDQYGPKRVLMIGVVWMGLGLMVFSRVRELWMLYLVWPAMVNLGAHLSEYSPNAAAVAKWFIRYRGRAMGILSGVGGAGAVWIPFLMVWMIGASDDPNFGWQKTAIILGVVTIFYGLLLGQVHRPKPPEAYGLRPDGRVSDQEESLSLEERLKTEAAAEFTMKQVLRTRAFWLLGIGGMLSGPAFSALMLFLIPIFEEKGVSFQRASIGWMAFYAGAIPARLIMGPLEGRFEIRRVNAFATLQQALGFVLFLFADSATAMYAVLWFIGLGVGAKTPIGMSIIANYFGRTNYASIRGWSGLFHTVSGATGPIFFAWLADRTDSFALGIAILAAVTAAGGVLLYFAKKPGAPAGVIAPAKARQ